MGLVKAIGFGIVGAAAVAAGLALYSTITASKNEALVPANGRFIEVDGARLHYVDMGSGPPIVMVHGLNGQLRHFTYALAEKLVPHHRLIILDRPGSGYSTWTGNGGHGIREQAAVIGCFIRALHLDQPLLVGHSLGGAIALALAVDEPDLLGGLALLAPLTQPMAEPPAVFAPLVIRSPVLRWLVARTLAIPLARFGRGRTLAEVFGPDAVPRGFSRHAGGLLANRPRAIHAASAEISVGSRYLVELARRYGELAVPLGILFGREDRLLSPAHHGEVIARLVPGAQLELIDGGHMIVLTAPDATADWILQQARQSRATNDVRAGTLAAPTMVSA